MASKTSNLKFTKDGKVSFLFPEEIKQGLIETIDKRIRNEQVPHYLFFLLDEAKNSLRKEGRIKMRKSEFYAVFHDDQMKYIQPVEVVSYLRSQFGHLQSTTGLRNF